MTAGTIVERLSGWVYRSPNVIQRGYPLPSDAGQGEHSVTDARAATPAVRLVGVTKTFGDVVAVDGVDLDIVDGEFFSLLGPSGSGKTTMLRMIAGFELPTAGAILLQGVDVTHRPPFDRDVNTVFQDYALFPHMTVEQNVGYGLMVKKVKKAERRRLVADALERVRLGGYGEAQAEPALGRSAPAGRAGPRPRQPPEGAAARRAARRPRPQAPRRDAGGAEVHPARGGDHVHLRHPRSRGSAHHERPHRRVQPRSHRAGRHARRGLRAPQPPRFVAGFVGTSNLLDGAAAVAVLGREGTFTVRPEKIRLAELDAVDERPSSPRAR